MRLETVVKQTKNLAALLKGMLYLKQILTDIFL